MLIALGLATQPIATDLYMPALPAVTRELAPGQPGVIGLSMTLLVLCFGLGQLVSGPLADRHGRRPCLLAGLWLLCLGGLGCTLAASAWQLNLARALQGFALAPILVSCRAAVRDRFTPAEGPVIMSRALTGLGAVALFSPVLGAWVTQHLGWRWSLGLTMLYAGGLALAAHRYFGESLAPRGAATAAGAVPTGRADRDKAAQSLALVFRDAHFRAWTGVVSATWIGLFCFLLLSPLVYIDHLGLSTAAYGWIPAAGSLVYILGGRWCQRRLRDLGPARLVRQAALISLAGGLTQAAGVLIRPDPLWWLLAGHFMYAWAHASHQACGQAGVISHLPQAAGKGSAWSGFLMMLSAFVVGQLAAAFIRPGHPHGAWPMVLPMLASGVALVLLAFGPVARLRDPGSALHRAADAAGTDGLRTDTMPR